MWALHSRTLAMWGVDVVQLYLPVVCKPLLWSWRWEAQGSPRSFTVPSPLVEDVSPVVAALIYSVQEWQSATTPLQSGSRNKWKALIVKRGYDLFLQSKLALVFTKEGWALWQAKSADCLTGVFGKINVLWWGVSLVLVLVFVFCISYIELHLSSYPFCRIMFDGKGWAREPEKIFLLFIQVVTFRYNHQVFLKYPWAVKN